MSRAASTVDEPPAPDAGADKPSSLLRSFCAMSWIAAAHLLRSQATYVWLVRMAICKRARPVRKGGCSTAVTVPESRMWHNR